MDEKAPPTSADAWLPETERKRLAEELTASGDLAARYKKAFDSLPPGDWEIWNADLYPKEVAAVLDAVAAFEAALERSHPEMSRFVRLDVVHATTAMIRGEYSPRELANAAPSVERSRASTDCENRAGLRLKFARRPPGWRPAD